jgi:hypothetical protein
VAVVLTGQVAGTFPGDGSRVVATGWVEIQQDGSATSPFRVVAGFYYADNPAMPPAAAISATVMLGPGDYVIIAGSNAVATSDFAHAVENTEGRVSVTMTVAP